MPTLFYQAITVVSAVFSLVVLIVTIRKLAQASPYSKLPPFIGIVAAAAITFAYVWLVQVEFNVLVGAGLAVFGFLIGLWQGRTARLYVHEQRVVVKRSLASLILWGAACVFSMALTLTENSLLAAGGVLALLFGLGATLGTNLNLLVRSSDKVLAGGVAAPPPQKMPR